MLATRDGYLEQVIPRFYVENFRKGLKKMFRRLTLDGEADVGGGFEGFLEAKKRRKVVNSRLRGVARAPSRSTSKANCLFTNSWTM